MALHPCQGCHYFYGTYIRCCNYMFEVGHSRPCEAGWDCTCWKPKKDGIQRPQKPVEKEPMVPVVKVLYTKNCLRCGKEFITTREKKKYCCYHCQDRARKKRQKQRKK